jgi:hypothetical protein
MARTVTLAYLRQHAQERPDMVNATFIATSVWNDMINASASELYDLLTTVYEDYFSSSYDFSTLANTSSYDLPTDFYKFLGLDQSVGSPQPVTCQPYEMAERNRFQDFNQANQKFSLLYVPACPRLVLDTDIFDGVNGWEEYIVVDVARKAKEKEESDTTELVNSKSALIKRIEDSAPNRNAGQPGRVTDIHRERTHFYNVARYRLMGSQIQLKSAAYPWGYL